MDKNIKNAFNMIRCVVITLIQAELFIMMIVGTAIFAQDLTGSKIAAIPAIVGVLWLFNEASTGNKLFKRFCEDQKII